MVTTEVTQAPRGTIDMESLIIQRTLRVPRLDTEPGDSAALARQLDASLLTVGFKLAGELLHHLSAQAPNAVHNQAVRVLTAVRLLVGDHVEHNVYFRDFPNSVPATLEFWVDCIRQALRDGPNPAVIEAQLAAGYVNLLDLPTYGTYQHSYDEMLTAHDALIPSIMDRVTVLHLGGTVNEEAHDLYLSLASSQIPLSETDLVLLGELATRCLNWEQPDTVPVRENLAVINIIRLRRGRPLGLGTVTDALRVACGFCGGDVTLTGSTRFGSIPRRVRLRLMTALNTMIGEDPAKLGDIPQYREQWKRLGERLHPHEYPHLPHAQDVFAVARRGKTARSLVARIEHAFDCGDRVKAVTLLSRAPGMLLRNTDRLLRSATPEELDAVVPAIYTAMGGTSGRVLLSLREHLTNRTVPAVARVFPNRQGRAWVTDDRRPPLGLGVTSGAMTAIDDELCRRMPTVDHLVMDPAVLGLTLPLSHKSTADGFGVMPRGSVTHLDGGILRFFTYWRQAQRCTDFDLSVLLLDEDFRSAGWLSWTNLRGVGGVHSGDITVASKGASEFIDLHLSQVDARYIVPQVHVYSGEGFEEVAESLFGFMVRDPAQRGAPFEPRTVRMRSGMRGRGRTALPVVFQRDDTGGWSAKWLHLYLSGHPQFNRVKDSHRSTSLLARAIVERQYLTVGDYLSLMISRASKVTICDAGTALPGTSVTFVGIERPEGLAAGSQVYTLDRLHELVVP